MRGYTDPTPIRKWKKGEKLYSPQRKTKTVTVKSFFDNSASVHLGFYAHGWVGCGTSIVMAAAAMLTIGK